MREKLFLEDILMDRSSLRWPRQVASAPANCRVLGDNDGAMPRRIAVAKGPVTRLVAVESIRWITTNDGVVRLHMKDGELELAIGYLKRFIAVWKDADPELQPRVAAARQRIAALSRPP